ncbi:prefoldin, alpha subunit [Cladophialophora yegresii CBS 114405]|uniref:Prefoldin, alpha subunit n=1 Tax=Cladophialophora yegresii CBS 114405 TaxID=1182544 RepID=W9VTP5_9EURO|nr:prefoldin, alpha subunit [Cladophialophora yegresii CBS 114405]EXJ55536.1 prefoldin, alpha subunit [Cladophialophora yegresii CBS 114405]
MSQSAQGGGGGGVDISTLSVQQLSALQARLSQELEHLSTSYQRLRAAQARFRDCIKSIRDGVEGKSGGTPLLIPLTTSLYIPGTLAPTSGASSSSQASLLVDVGTGFFVEKTPKDGITFYQRKIEELAKNLADIEKVVTGKSENLRIIEDVLRRKMVDEQPRQFGAGGGGGSANAVAAAAVG